MERAFDLAKAGEVQNIEHLHQKLIAEGYANPRRDIAGPSLTKQLRGLIKIATAERQESP